MTDDCRIASLHEAFKTGAQSPVDVARSQLKAIASAQATVNAFSHVDSDLTMEMAEASHQRYKNGEPIGLLDGVPISLKDSVNIAGWPTRRGSHTTFDTPASTDAISVKRLRQTGAVFVGKTTMPEFAWKGVTDSPQSGVTTNPLDQNLTPGGSSGGASAAIAAGIGIMAVGTDAAGSVRIPSAFCGTVGFKPSFGRIPLDPFAVGFFQLPHIGPIAATVADAALTTAAMAGPTAVDWTSQRHGPLEIAISDLAKRPESLRIGLMSSAHLPDLAPEVAAGWSEFLSGFQSELDDAVELELSFAEARDIAGWLYRIGCADAVRSVPQNRRALLDPELLEFIAPIDELSATKLIAICRLREQIASRAAIALIEEADVVITPTMGVLPPSIADLREPGASAKWLDWNLFTPMFNVSHGPAISVPWPTKAGFPIGIQVAAAPGRDLLVLQLARRIEQLANYRPAPLALP